MYKKTFLEGNEGFRLNGCTFRSHTEEEDLSAGSGDTHRLPPFTEVLTIVQKGFTSVAGDTWFLGDPIAWAKFLKIRSNRFDDTGKFVPVNSRILSKKLITENMAIIFNHAVPWNHHRKSAHGTLSASMYLSDPAGPVPVKSRNQRIGGEE